MDSIHQLQDLESRHKSLRMVRELLSALSRGIAICRWFQPATGNQRELNDDDSP